MIMLKVSLQCNRIFVTQMLLSVLNYLIVAENRLSNLSLFLWLSVVLMKSNHPSVRSAKMRTRMPDELVPMKAKKSFHISTHSSMISCRSASLDPFLGAALYFACSAAKNLANASI